MIKLSDILKEVSEGAKVTFDDKKEPSSIEIAYSHIDGEQLNTDDDLIKKYGYKVFYSLSSDPKATNVKASEDALKYSPGKIKPAELQDLLKRTVGNRLPKVDYIGSLESKGGLNNLLISTLQKIYPEAKTIAVEKIEYKVIDNAVDWDRFTRQTDSVKKSLVNFLYKSAEKLPPYKIRKSDKLQSMIIKLLHSKYNIGLHPSGEGEKFPPVYNAIVECLTEGKILLIVDDNMHTGTDFYKIFEGIERIREKVVEVNSKPTDKEKEAAEKLEKLKKHPKFKSSDFIQKEVPKLEKELEMYRARVSILNRNVNRSHDCFFGYALYLLKDSDLKR